MKNKKSQITVFILLGIVMVSAFSFFFYTKSAATKTGAAAQLLSRLDILNKKPIETYALTCLKKVSENALFNISFQGGYLDPTCTNDYSDCSGVNYYDDNGHKIPVYYEGRRTIPVTIEEIESKLANYIVIEFENCLNFEVFEKEGYVITNPSVYDLSLDYDLRTGSSIKTVVNLNEEDVSISVHYPMKITLGESNMELSDFKVSIPVRLKQLYNKTLKLIETIENNYPLPSQYDLSTDCTSYDEAYSTGFCNEDISIYVNKKAISKPTEWIIAITDMTTANKNRLLYHYGEPLSFYFVIKKINLTKECYYNMEGSC